MTGEVGHSVGRLSLKWMMMSPCWWTTTACLHSQQLIPSKLPLWGRKGTAAILDHVLHPLPSICVPFTTSLPCHNPLCLPHIKYSFFPCFFSVCLQHFNIYFPLCGFLYVFISLSLSLSLSHLSLSLSLSPLSLSLSLYTYIYIYTHYAPIRSSFISSFNSNLTSLIWMRD